MKHLKLSVKHRNRTGTSRCNQVRNEGFIPGVIYGSSGTESIKIHTTDFRNVMRQAAGGAALIDITVDNGKQMLAVVQKVDRHPTKDHVLHVDFHELSADKPMHISLPIHVHGEAEGVRAGGIIDVVMHSIAVTCLPKHLQEAVNVDISTLNIGDLVHVSDLPKLEGVTYNMEPSVVVVSCVPPKISVATEEVEAEAEPVAAE